MADREQSHTSKRGMDEKPQGDIAGKGHPNSRSKGEERGHGVRTQARSGATCRTKARKGTRKSRSRLEIRGRASISTASVKGDIRPSRAPLKRGSFLPA